MHVVKACESFSNVTNFLKNVFVDLGFFVLARRLKLKISTEKLWKFYS